VSQNSGRKTVIVMRNDGKTAYVILPSGVLRPVDRPDDCSEEEFLKTFPQGETVSGEYVDSLIH
jgi:hypothetical protein